MLLAALVAAGLLAACDGDQPTPSPSPSASVAASPDASADASAGGIEGLVVDADGNPLADIIITIQTNEFHGDTRTTEDGTFSALGVTGEFVITASSLGYENATQRVEVEPGQLVEVTLTMQPSAD